MKPPFCYSPPRGVGGRSLQASICRRANQRAGLLTWGVSLKGLANGEPALSILVNKLFMPPAPRGVLMHSGP